MYDDAMSVAKANREKEEMEMCLDRRIQYERTSGDLTLDFADRMDLGALVYPIETDLRTLAADVYDRWLAEKAGADEGAVMRVVPNDYFFWRGDRKAEHNWFRKNFDDYKGETHSWGLASPYED